MIDPDRIDWQKQGGLVPAIIQDAETLRVLMLGYMSREAFDASLASGRVVFHSRRRNALWTKGEESGNVLKWVHIDTDCDGDTLLIRAHPAGPTCHLGRCSCFAKASGDVVMELDRRIVERQHASPATSYVARLLAEGVPRLAQKVGEEGVETALAAVSQPRQQLVEEAADLVFHLLVLLRAAGLDWAQLAAELQRRRQE